MLPAKKSAKPMTGVATSLYAEVNKSQNHGEDRRAERAPLQNSVAESARQPMEHGVFELGGGHTGNPSGSQARWCRPKVDTQ